MKEFVNDQDEASLKIPLPSLSKKKDLFSGAKKKMRGLEGLGG